MAYQIKLVWTTHATMKMRFYGLSEYRVKRVIDYPKRIEKGIAEETLGLMQPAGSAKHPYEIWVMIQDEKSKDKRNRRIISAWKYPGVTKPGEPLPREILSEIREAGI
jgi:hypothetical protein